MGRKSLIEPGQRYKMLVVTRKVAVKRWECVCDCGKIVVRGSVALLHGDTHSCGCLHSRNLITVNLTEQRFGRLTVIAEAPRLRPRVRRWECVCDCGKTKIVNQADLRNGNTRSCGCLQAQHRANVAQIALKTRNGFTNHPLFVTWRNMMDRCYKTSDRSYKNYGGRGITVCERWHQVENFIADMGAKPFPKATLERKNNDGNYCPENCIWASRTTQTRNKRNTRRVVLNGIEYPLAELAEQYGIPVRVVRARLDRYRWTLERALATPILTPSLQKQ